MGSGTSFFNGTVYKNALRRFWPLGLGFGAVGIFRLQQIIGRSPSFLLRDLSVYLGREGLMSFLPMAAACLTALAVYGWLYQQRSTAFLSALPVRREALFLSHMAAGLTIQLASLVLTLVVTPLMSAGYGMTFSALGHWFLISVLLCVAYFGFASFCALLTGHFAAMPALYLILLYAAVALEASLRRIAQFLIFGLSGQRWALTALSPVYHLRTHVYDLLTADSLYWEGQMVEIRFAALPLLLSYAAAGIVFAALATAMLRRRPMESAGDVVAVPWLRVLFPWCAAAAAALSVGLMTLESIFGFSGYASAASSFHRTVILLLLMLLGGFIGWFGAQMLLRKTLRVFDRHWGGWAALSLVVAAMVLGCRLDVLGVSRRLPDPEEVERATITCYYAGVNGIEFRERESIEAVVALQDTVIENRSAFTYDGPAADAGGTLQIDYYGADGKILMRRAYASPAGEMAWTSSGDAVYWVTGGNVLPQTVWGSANPVLPELERVVNLPEAVKGRMTTDWMEICRETAQSCYLYMYEEGGMMELSLDLDGAETWELYETALLPDSRDSSLGSLRLTPDPEGEYARGRVKFYLSFGETRLNRQPQWWGFMVTNTADSRRTNAWLEKHCILLDAEGRVTAITGNPKTGEAIPSAPLG